MKITCRNNKVKESITYGSILKLIDSDDIIEFGIVSRIDAGKINVICLKDGNRYFDSVSNLEDLEKEMVDKKYRWEILKNVELIFD